MSKARCVLWPMRFSGPGLGSSHAVLLLECADCHCDRLPRLPHLPLVAARRGDGTDTEEWAAQSPHSFVCFASHRRNDGVRQDGKFPREVEIHAGPMHGGRNRPALRTRRAQDGLRYPCPLKLFMEREIGPAVIHDRADVPMELVFAMFEAP